MVAERSKVNKARRWDQCYKWGGWVSLGGVPNQILFFQIEVTLGFASKDRSETREELKWEMMVPLTSKIELEVEGLGNFPRGGIVHTCPGRGVFHEVSTLGGGCVIQKRREYPVQGLPLRPRANSLCQTQDSKCSPWPLETWIWSRSCPSFEAQLRLTS